MNNLKPLLTLSLTALFLLGSNFSFAANDNPSSENTPTNICISHEDAIIALAYLNTQGGTLEIAAEILSQISALKISSSDFTKAPSELETLEITFIELRDFLNTLQGQKFLDIPLFENTPDASFPKELVSSPDLAQAIHEVTEATNLLEVTLESIIASEDSVIDLRSQNNTEATFLENLPEL